MHSTTAVISRPDLIDALSGSDICFTCRGSGKIQVRKEDRDGLTCPACRGRGVRPTTATMRPAPRPF